MAGSLNKCGLYIDDVSKICILDPEVTKQTYKLKEECHSFVDKITEFQRNSNELIEIVEKLAKEVEQEKMKSVGARNLLRSIEKERDAQMQQMKALIVEKSMELERLRVQYDFLRKLEAEQLETIEHLAAN